MQITLTSTLGHFPLTQLIKGIFKYRTRLRQKIAEFMQEIAQEGTRVASEAFGAEANVTVEMQDERHYVIRAEGDIIAFLEFGTGVYTDSGHPLANEMPFKVEPGSWSETHARRWQQWIAAGKDPYKFPYNRHPKRGMLRASAHMRDNAREIARTVFSR